jgi:hypothetical protein
VPAETLAVSHMPFVGKLLALPDHRGIQGSDWKIDVQSLVCCNEHAIKSPSVMRPQAVNCVAACRECEVP